MDKRYIIATVLLTVGLLLMAGTVGSMEFDDISIGQALIRGGIGCVMAFAAVPVSGDYERR